jgi:hypothetical protein
MQGLIDGGMASPPSLCASTSGVIIVRLARNCHDQPRKTGAAAEIDPFAKRRRRVVEELKAVRNMPRPHLDQRGMRDEVVHTLPLGKQRHIAFKVAPRATAEAEARQRICGRGRLMPRLVRRGLACV